MPCRATRLSRSSGELEARLSLYHLTCRFALSASSQPPRSLTHSSISLCLDILSAPYYQSSHAMAAVITPTEITPSKKVCRSPLRVPYNRFHKSRLTRSCEQAASVLENLSMSSPAKKLGFSTVATDYGIVKAKPLVGLPKLAPKTVETVDAIVAPGSVEAEIDEPLLRENPNRFVLFPIRYHEVRWPHHLCQASFGCELSVH